MKGVFAAGVAAVLVSLLAGAAGAAASASGLHGRVCRTTLTGAEPRTCTITQPAVLRLSGGGRTITLRTKPDGTYRLVAPAGVYRVTLIFRTALPVSLRPALVRIRAGHDDRLDFWLGPRPL